MNSRDQGRQRPAGDTPTARLEAMSRDQLEELALGHLQALYRAALRLTGDHMAAEDLVQETYLKAANGFKALRDPDRMRPWLFRIMSRLATDRFRATRREIPVGSLDDVDRFSLYDLIWEEDPLPYSERLHDDFLSGFRDEEVRAAVAGLPVAYGVPLVLLYAVGLSYRELSEVLDCPIGTVMSRLHRGRKLLEKALWECAKARGLVRTWKT